MIIIDLYPLNCKFTLQRLIGDNGHFSFTMSTMLSLASRGHPETMAGRRGISVSGSIAAFCLFPGSLCTLSQGHGYGGWGSGGSVPQPCAQTPGNLTDWHGSLTPFWDPSHYRHTVPIPGLALPPCEWNSSHLDPSVSTHWLQGAACPVTGDQLWFGHVRELLHHPISTVTPSPLCTDPQVP